MENLYTTRPKNTIIVEIRKDLVKGDLLWILKLQYINIVRNIVNISKYDEGIILM
jgi:hypothetical protein